MSGHTGGPWQQKHDFDREGLLTIIGNVDGEYVDGVPHCTYTTICEVDDNEDGLANSRLIAAAPDLLAALQGLLGNEPWLQKAYRAALKYTCVHCGREYHGPDSDEVLPEHCADDCPGEIARAAIAKASP